MNSRRLTRSPDLRGCQSIRCRTLALKQLLHRNAPRYAMSAAALGRAKTQTCCGDIEWRSQASDVRSFSREARLLQPTDAQAQKSRKLCGSYSSGARDSRLAFMPRSRRWFEGVVE